MLKLEEIKNNWVMIFYNHFKGNININIPTSDTIGSKYFKSILYCEVEPVKIDNTRIIYNIKFDKYDKEFIFYTSVNRTLEQHIKDFKSKLDDVVFKTFDEDNNIKKLYSYNCSIFDGKSIKKLIRRNKIAKLNAF